MYTRQNCRMEWTNHESELDTGTGEIEHQGKYKTCNTVTLPMWQVALENPRCLEKTQELCCKPAPKTWAFEQVCKPNQCCPVAFYAQHNAFPGEAQLVVATLEPESDFLAKLSMCIACLGQQAPLQVESRTVCFQCVSAHDLNNPLRPPDPWQFRWYTKSLQALPNTFCRSEQKICVGCMNVGSVCHLQDCSWAGNGDTMPIHIQVWDLMLVVDNAGLNLVHDCEHHRSVTLGGPSKPSGGVIWNNGVDQVFDWCLHRKNSLQCLGQRAQKTPSTPCPIFLYGFLWVWSDNIIWLQHRKSMMKSTGKKLTLQCLCSCELLACTCLIFLGLLECPGY